MDVLCIGHAAWDLSVLLPSYPAENTKSETETLVECGGGPAANAAWLLSRWGLACALAASLGDDAYAERIVREMTDAGADVSLVRRSAEDVTPVSMIVVNHSNGNRTVINRKGARGGKPLTLAPPAWNPAPRVLLFDGHELEASLDAMRLFPEATTILDAGSLREGTRVLASRVDYLVSSERFACQSSELDELETPEKQRAAIAAIARPGGKPVVITLGERGLIFGDGEGIVHLPAFPARAVDTTGAGDVFHGAFAYGIAMGLPWPDVLRLASAAAALSVTVHGGRTSIPTFEQVQEMLRNADEPRLVSSAKLSPSATFGDQV